jgi:hypothetical protein
VTAEPGVPVVGVAVAGVEERVGDDDYDDDGDHLDVLPGTARVFRYARTRRAFGKPAASAELMARIDGTGPISEANSPAARSPSGNTLS